MKLKEILKKAKQLEKEWKEQQKAKETEIPADFKTFCQKFLKLELTSYQLEAAELLEKHNDIALRWCRQSGKTHLIAAWLLHYALTHPNSHIAIVGPSWRQTIIPHNKNELLHNQTSKRSLPQTPTNNRKAEKRQRNTSFPKQPKQPARLFASLCLC
ncbi:hypothetical protein DRO44_04400 [Candidatus Bathyarchaeota archaeon]|nr:MAG: hypothetical protein DRO44_04400 [Candidatus Bathyarchaeota archaeon]